MKRYYETLVGLENAIVWARLNYHRGASSSKRDLAKALEEHYRLWWEAVELPKQNQSSDLRRAHILEQYVLALRKVLASLVLLESGFPSEAHSIVRGALEYLLLALVITLSKQAWKKWYGFRSITRALSDRDEDEKNEFSFTSMLREVCKRDSTQSYKDWKDAWDELSAAYVHPTSLAVELTSRRGVLPVVDLDYSKSEKRLREHIRPLIGFVERLNLHLGNLIEDLKVGKWDEKGT